MNTIKCGNCGAPLNPTPAEIEKAFATCGYCNSANVLNLYPPPLDYRTKVPQPIDLPPDNDALSWSEPANRPADTRIELVNEPGVRFAARVPRQRLSFFKIMFGGFITLLWCAIFALFSLMIIALTETTIWRILFAVFFFSFFGFCIGMVLWYSFGQETILAENGRITLVKGACGLNKRKKFAWDEVKGPRLQPILLTDKQPVFHLYLDLGSRKIRLAGRATGDEVRWLYTELNVFFEPIKKSKHD
ncbi:MAG: hypothetical protein GX444_10805 [Myxococcales bacterium]|nr:hypothetical protein [Myxococcales bacterium]